MPTLRFYLMLFILSLAFPGAAQRTDHALFFYVTDFEHWPDFPGSTARQVRDLEQELKNNYGFQTEVVANPTRRQILNKLNSYRKRPYGPKDQLLIYFSLHGHFEKQGTGAIIPKDGKLRDEFYESWITHPLLEDLVNRIPCNHITLALDACYSGTFGPEYRSKPNAPAWDNRDDCASKTNNALRYKSRLYLTSGGEERTPTNSQFADKWLEALRLRNGDGVLGFHELFGVLSEAIPRPMFGDFRGHVKGGDFVFVDREKCQPAPALTDAGHWQNAGPTPSREALLEHLRLFPGCTHETEALAILSGGNLSQPSNPPFVDRSPKRDSDSPDNMVLVKGGTFQMGSADGDDDEKPVHSMTLSDYYISRHEVTFADYDAFCNATGKTLPDDEGWGRNQHPVINVSWYDAVEYCNWLSEQHNLQPVYTISGNKVTANWNADGYRLPTEAEWDYAARSRGGKDKWAGTSSESNLASYANYYETGDKDKDGYENTAPVGSFSANALGLHDMSGNVWEWCWDWYDSNYYGQSTKQNPIGPDTGFYRVLRGGSCNGVPSNLRCTNRYGRYPGRRSNNFGFRLSRAAF